jgi:hypothetical protein
LAQQLTQAQIAKMQAAQQAANDTFMQLSYEQPILANAQNGTNYAPGGNPLNFDVPIVPGAFLTRLTIRHRLTVNYTPAGSGAYENLTAAGEYAVFQNVEVRFGNRQIEVHPYVAKVLAQLAGYNRTDTNRPLGNVNNDIQAMLYTNPTVNSGDNEWTFDVDIPLTLLHPMSVNGILPISGSGTRVQVSLQPTASFVGKDPLLNVIDTNGSVTVSGTVEVIAWYRDWQSMTTRQALAPSLAGLSTVQVIKPQSINPLSAGTPNFKRITNPYPFVKLIHIVIDGQQSGKFVSDASNIQLYEIDKAENTSSAFIKYDATNGGMQNYYKRVRELYGQDLDSGVIVFDATAMNTANPSNRNGRAFLDLTPNGYPAARVGFQVGQVGTGTYGTPRVETWGVIINPMGIQAV